MAGLQDDTRINSELGVLTAQLPCEWGIRGPNGGFLAALALRAAGSVAPEGHRPATFSAQFLKKGRFDDVSILIDMVHRGAETACINVAIRQRDVTLCQAQVRTTSRTSGPELLLREMPRLSEPEKLSPIQDFYAPGTPPSPFFEHFDIRPATFVDEATTMRERFTLNRWFRFLDFPATPDPFVDNMRVVMLVDTMLWYTHLRGLRDVPDYVAVNVDLSVWVHDARPVSDWMLVNVVADVASNGLIFGETSVWSQDRRLLATGGSHLLTVKP